MTLHVHRGERADTLADALAEVLADPLPDPFLDEVVAVPARGIERWLAQRLSHRLGRSEGRADGICAGVRFPPPALLVAEAAGWGTGARRREDPWTADRLVWPLLQVIEQSAGEPWCATLQQHLGPPGRVEEEGRSRRYAVARRLAGLFDAYATQRAGMLTDWIAGRDTDGLGAPLPPDLAWQAELWRRLRAGVDAPDPVAGVAAVLERLRDEPDAVDLPPRLSLFGPTRLARHQLEVLAALAVHRDVHLWLPHPSPVLWAAVRASGMGPHVRRRDASVTVAANPLLASLGRDSREVQLTLSAVAHTDRHHPGRALPDTLLGRLQGRLRDDRADVPPGEERPPVAPDDRSVQVHACAGPARQVEVLREVLVGLLARDPTLEPRDILVMCPDVETFAPLVSAAFGLADVVPADRAHPAHQLRVRLADRAVEKTNPLLGTVTRLLDLASGRAPASEMLDLAAWPPVRRRFRLDDDDLEQLGRWIADSGVRWGLDAAHRAPFRLQQFPQNTWQTGLDRILVGVAMAEESGNHLGRALPLDDVGSGGVELAGRLAELVDRVATAVDALSGRHPLRHWVQALTDALAALTEVGRDEAWQRTEMHHSLQEIVDGAGGLADSVDLGRGDVRALLDQRLQGRPTRANFRTGTLTVCTMVPMRSVPHRVIALVGLDDGVFPRRARPDGDDILAREPVTGERDARGEDRQLLLDALMAATEHLVVTYSGTDERSGAPKPPAVPVGELLDELDRCGRDGRDHVVVHHPLQPFDFRSVTAGALGAPGPFSHDPTVLAAACAVAGDRVPVPPFLDRPLAVRPPADVDLADLLALLLHPARGFLRQRLDVAQRFEDDEPGDALTVEMDALQRWDLGDRILRDRLRGLDVQACRAAEWRRGRLPPGPLGGAALEAVLAEVEPLVAAGLPLLAGPGRSVDVTVDLGGGRRLRGTVPDVHDGCAVTVGFSRLGPKAQLTAWVWALALAAGRPDAAWTAVAVGRGRGGRAALARFGPLPPRLAQEALRQLVDVYDRGLAGPLPLPLKTAAAYARAVRGARGEDEALGEGQVAWTSRAFPGEDADPAHQLVWGPNAPLSDLLAAPPGPDEQWSGADSRFAELAVRVWSPLLNHASLEER